MNLHQVLSDAYLLKFLAIKDFVTIHLKKYLNTRTDKNPALFVSIRNPHKRLLAGGVELMLKKMGEQCDIHHVHLHKFRRTMATTAIDKGMPIEQVQRLLGHEKIDTTLHYAMVKQSNVKVRSQEVYRIAVE